MAEGQRDEILFTMFYLHVWYCGLLNFLSLGGYLSLKNWDLAWYVYNHKTLNIMSTQFR